MYSCDFIHKLKRCNRYLYVSDSQSVVNAEWRSQGLYVRRRTQAERIEHSLLVQADSKTRQFVKDQESGQRDEFVCAVPSNWVPEYPVFDQLTGKLLARGWRGVLTELVNRGLVDRDTAVREFGCSSLGETDYDRLSFDEKRYVIKKDQEKRKSHA